MTWSSEKESWALTSGPSDSRAMRPRSASISLSTKDVFSVISHHQSPWTLAGPKNPGRGCHTPGNSLVPCKGGLRLPMLYVVHPGNSLPLNLAVLTLGHPIFLARKALSSDWLLSRPQEAQVQPNHPQPPHAVPPINRTCKNWGYEFQSWHHTQD